jgi:hypothetical protein
MLLLLCLALLCGAALADPLPLGEDLTDTLTFPEEAGEEAIYAYTYILPQVTGGEEAVEPINDFYAYQAKDVGDYTIYVKSSGVMDPGQPAWSRLTYRITANTDEYFSVLQTEETLMDGVRSVSYQAQVFGRHTAKAGSVLTLPYLLGILDEEESDEWLLDRQTNRANDCVRLLIGEELERRGITEVTGDELLYDFFPEEDFYYDAETDSLVFFLQPYILPDEDVDTFLTFSFTLDEILDEL